MKETICNCIAELLGGLVGSGIQGGAVESAVDAGQGALEGFAAQDLMHLVTVPPEENMGDFAFPCFSLAKVLHMSPMSIAESLANALTLQGEKLGIAKAEAVNGYLNIYVNRKEHVENCLMQLSEPDFGLYKSGVGKTVCMDYSSPNIAKNFHVGHLRTTVIGNSLYKIYDKLGWQVVRINHLGDWGTQFGKLIVAYLKWSSKEAVEEKGIDELLRIYVKFNEEAKKDATLTEEARKWFVRMEQGDAEALEIWQWFKDISMVEFERVYGLLDMSFDYYTGESFFRNKVPALVEELKEKHLLSKSQGADVIDLQEYDMPPCLILKSDGGSIYHSRDIAALLYRQQEYAFDKCLYVTGLEQTLHFKQVFQAIALMGYEWHENLVHVPYGLVSLKGEKLSTRNGNIIYAEDILKEAIERALHAIEEKNPKLQEKEAVAEMVGIGAVIFHDLYNQRIKNVDFSWDEVLSFEGNTGPYVQYTYARAKSILRKAGRATEGKSSEDCKLDAHLKLTQAGTDKVEKDKTEGTGKEELYKILTEDAAYALVKVLMGYSDAVEKAAQKYEPSVLARFAIDVATAFNRFYHDCPILQAPDAVKTARLMLVEITANMLFEVCALLGVKCPEEM